MRYGPASYHALGRVYPRSRQREPFARVDRKADRLTRLFGAPPSPPTGPLLDFVIAMHDIVDSGTLAQRGAGDWPAFTTTTSGGWQAHVDQYVIPAAIKGFKTQLVRAAGGIDGGSSTIKLDDILRADEQGFTQLGQTGFVTAFSAAKSAYGLTLIAHLGGDLKELIVRVGSVSAYSRAQTILQLYWDAGFRYLSFDTGGVRDATDPLWAWITATVIPMGFTILVEPPPANATPTGAMAYGTFTIYSVYEQYIDPTDPLGYDAQHLYSLLQGYKLVQVPDQTSISATANYTTILNGQGASSVVPIWWVLGQGYGYSDLVSLLGVNQYLFQTDEGLYSWQA